MSSQIEFLLLRCVNMEIPYLAKACFLSGPCAYGRRRRKLCGEESSPAAAKIIMSTIC
jgi:hypothetical protein